MELTCLNTGLFPWRTVTKQIPSYLKLVTDTTTEPPAVASEDLAALVEVRAGLRAELPAGGWNSSRLQRPVQNKA